MTTNQLRLIFYLFWFISLALQSFLVYLGGDEAYYWMYTRQLAWGYFDHPPVTALLVKMGYLIFNNELGVRLFFIILNTATIFLLEILIRPANLKLFYGIFLSLSFLQMGLAFGGGMYAIPDFPLLFFTAAFFLLYKKYLDKPNSIAMVLLLSLVCSLMLLSKYHGILVIGFTVLSNLRLLQRGSFWVIVSLSIALFVPHLLWQFNFDFPSIKYHLLERSTKPYSISYTLEYLAAQPFIMGPFISVLLLLVGFMFKPTDSFERGLKFVIVGTYGFFLLMTWKGRVEANWTIITLVPLIYVGYNYFQQNERWKKAAHVAMYVSIPLILMARVLLIANVDRSFLRLGKYIDSNAWVKELKNKTGGVPVAFMNSYQKASLYAFYSGVESISLNNVWGRKNQFSLWDSEANLQGEKIALVLNYERQDHDSIPIAGETFNYLFIDNFRSHSNIKISLHPSELRVTSGDTLRLVGYLNYSNQNKRDLTANPDLLSSVVGVFSRAGAIEDIKPSGLNLTNEMVGNSVGYSLVIPVTVPAGEYDLSLAIGTGWFPQTFNSEKYRLIVD